MPNQLLLRHRLKSLTRSRLGGSWPSFRNVASKLFPKTFGNRATVLLVALWVPLGCSGQTSASKTENAPFVTPDGWKPFQSYWYQGAEITRYELEQSRYGQKRHGDLILVYVTENFLAKKQVKHEFGPKDNAVPVLKLNAIRRFPTGIYDYSIMRSVFQPVKTDTYQHALKVSGSSQDWCGQAFYQLNHREDHYQIRRFSYFQAEGDQQLETEPVWQEDELWTLLRTRPDWLPVGEVRVLPGFVFQRLAHVELRPYTAQAKFAESNEDGLATYQLKYKGLDRVLEFTFERKPPYRIIRIRETHKGTDGEMHTTVAKRTQEIMTDYWNKNRLQDEDLRKRLGLKQTF